MAKTPSFEALVDRSEFILIGRVQRVGDATLPMVPVTDHTSVVLAEQVLRRPPGLGDFAGKQITVKFAAGYKLAKKQQLVIFASGWLYGTSIAVRENGRVPARPSVRREVTDVELRLLERALRERITRAEAIVTGRVKELRILPLGQESGTEAPEWAEVSLEIRSWEKPTAWEKALRVFCPMRPHPRFPSAPRLRTGCEGIFMLRPARVRGLKARIYFAEDPRDFQPLDRLELVRRIIGKAR